MLTDWLEVKVTDFRDFIGAKMLKSHRLLSEVGMVQRKSLVILNTHTKKKKKKKKEKKSSISPRKVSQSPHHGQCL